VRRIDFFEGLGFWFGAWALGSAGWLGRLTPKFSDGGYPALIEAWVEGDFMKRLYQGLGVGCRGFVFRPYALE